MKIVNLEQFRELPSGTLFMKYEPCVFEDLCAKGDTLEHDWLYENIAYSIECTSSDDFGNKLNDAEEQGISLAMDFDSTGRDGCFDDSQLFAVYEKADIEMLIDKLNRCKEIAYG